MDETNLRKFGYIVVPVDEINFRLPVRRKLLIKPGSHPLSLSEFPLSPVLPRHSLSLSRRRGWSAAGRGGRRAPVRGWPRGSRPRWAQRQAVAVRGCRARPAAGGPRRAGGRVRRPSEAGERHYRRRVQWLAAVVVLCGCVLLGNVMWCGSFIASIFVEIFFGVAIVLSVMRAQ